MMNDNDILNLLVKQIRSDNRVSPFAVAEFEKLVARFPEEGAETIYPFADLDEETEKALKNLDSLGYTTQSMRYRGPNDGHVTIVNLRGKRFLDLANGQTNAVVIGPMQDSGERQSFATGAVRDTADGKPRPDLISPFAMERLGEWLRLGSVKYTERNWEKGIPISRSLASLYRHLLKYQQGATDEDHMAAIMCNAMFIIHTENMIRRGRLPESLGDMPDYSAMPGVHGNGDDSLETEGDFQWKKLHDNT